MPMFVHLAPESQIARMRHNGISRLRRAIGSRPGGIFAVPVTRNFYISHQWLRELKGRNQGPIAGVYFRIADGELVWVGHYGQAHRRMTAAEAVAEFMAAESRWAGRSSSRVGSRPRRSTGCDPCRRWWAGGMIPAPGASRRTARASIARAESTGRDG